MVPAGYDIYAMAPVPVYLYTYSSTIPFLISLIHLGISSVIHLVVSLSVLHILEIELEIELQISINELDTGISKIELEITNSTSIFDISNSSND